jgi:hypothetical protein
MARRVVFTVQSPLGYRVTLTRSRWREIVRLTKNIKKGRKLWTS